MPLFGFSDRTKYLTAMNILNRPDTDPVKESFLRAHHGALEDQDPKMRANYKAAKQAILNDEAHMLYSTSSYINRGMSSVGRGIQNLARSAIKRKYTQNDIAQGPTFEDLVQNVQGGRQYRSRSRQSTQTRRKNRKYK